MAAALALVVVACGQAAPAPPPWLVSHQLGLAQGASPVGGGPDALRDTAVRATQDRIAVVSWGSSGCPRLPMRLVAGPGNTISITMSNGAPPPFSSCTADMAPTTSIVQLPAGVDDAQQLRVTIVDGTNGPDGTNGATVVLAAVDPGYTWTGCATVQTVESAPPHPADSRREYPPSCRHAPMCV